MVMIFNIGSKLTDEGILSLSSGSSGTALRVSRLTNGKFLVSHHVLFLEEIINVSQIDFGLIQRQNLDMKTSYEIQIGTFELQAIYHIV